MSQLAYNCVDVMNHQPHPTSWIQTNCSIYYAPNPFQPWKWQKCCSQHLFAFWQSLHKFKFPRIGNVFVTKGPPFQFDTRMGNAPTTQGPQSQFDR